VALYLVYGDLRVPWVYRLWRGEGEKSLSLLAPRLLAALPPWMRKAFGIRVVADAAFGTLCFRTGAQGMGLEAVVGMRRDRRTREGQRLLNLRRQGSGLSGLGQWVPLPSGSGGVWCHLSRPRKGRRRFRIGHFFKAMNSGFSLGRFGQSTPLGARRFLVLRFLAYLLARGAGGGGADLAGGGQGVPAPALARTCSSGGAGGTSCPRPLAPTAG
jgi:hypothetical protein